MKFLLIFIFFIFQITNMNSEEVLKKVHDESNIAPDDKGNLKDFKSYQNYCKVFSSHNGGFTRTLFSTDYGNTWDIEFLGPVLTSGTKIISSVDGDFNNGFTFVGLNIGYIYLQKNIGAEYDLIKTPSDYAIRQVQIYNDKFYFYDLRTLYRSYDTCKSFDTIVTMDGYNFTSFYIINDSTFFIGTNNYDSGTVPYFFITKDGGKNWIKKKGFEKQFHKVFFIDSIGWALTYLPTGVGVQERDVIYKTYNYGLDWEKIYDKANEPYIMGLADIDFKDSLNGIATGNWGKVLITNDGGYNWKQLFIDIDQKYYPGYVSCGISNDGNYFIGTLGYGIYKVVEGGSFVNYDTRLITIYDEYAYINLDRDFGYRIIELTTGIIIKKEKNIPNKIIDLSNLHKGAYMLEIETNTSLFRKKFIR